MAAHLLRSSKRGTINEDIADGDGYLTSPVEVGYSISRTGIDFFNVSSERVAMEIKVANLCDRMLPATSLIIQAAPFGAFVAWQPLVTLSVPPLSPGRVHYLRFGATPRRPEPLGRPDRVSPRKLLTALGLADDPPDDSLKKNAVSERPALSPKMPPGLMELLLQDTPHWAGNINILMANKDVERHRAQALRVYPGRMNLAWFIVGAGGRDAYAFQVRGLGDGWDAKLFDMTSRQSLVLNPDASKAIASNEWIDGQGSRTMLLALRVPSTCKAGTVEVHVTQRSTARTAVVEFSLDPRAAGRGCYVV